ncbi:MAG: hypothetical protein H7227_06360 [Actinobacteria bacterium]|nr:hypothetical protein [Actinomycetota bacterium]
MNSHDGLKDALTNLASPTLLYEELRRELARAKRSGVGFCAMKIILRIDVDKKSLPVTPESDVHRDFRISSLSERETLIFSRTLSNETRGEDICARMGGSEFLLLMQDFSLAHDVFIDRLVRQWTRQRAIDPRLSSVTAPRLEFSVALSRTDEGSLDFLNRLDLEPILVLSPIQ